MLEKVAVACGLANIYLTIRQNIWCWPVGVVMVSLYIYIFFNAKLYSDAGLNVFFLVMQFYGWYQWTRGGVEHSRSLSAVKRLSRKEWAWTIALARIVFAPAWQRLFQRSSWRICRKDGSWPVNVR